MPRANSKYNKKIAEIKAVKSQKERTSNECFNHFLLRTRETLSTRVDDKRCYVVSIPFQSGDVHKSIVEETLEITENLMKRLQAKVDKKKAYLANPIGENEVARPLFVDELTLEQRNKNFADCDFSENDVLYLSGHANFFIFGGLTPHELAKQYYDFLKITGIKEVKLAGCNTGSRFYEYDLPLLSPYTPEDLIHSYAMKFSQALLDLGLGDITVYGYRGSLSDQREKSKFEKVAFHSYVELYCARSQIEVLAA